MSGLVITGALTQARACVAGREGKDAVLVFEFGSGWPIEARWFLGTDPAAHLRAGQIVAALRRGDTITVDVAGLSPRTDFGTTTLVARGVTRICCGDVRLSL